MREIEILGKTFGKVYVKERVGGNPARYLCVCPCGEEFEADSQAIRRERTDCGCGAVNGIRKKPFKAGDAYQGSVVLEVGKIYRGQTFYFFKCAKCGEKSGRTHADFLKFPLCKVCTKKEATARKKEKIRAEFAGKTVNGIKILDVSGQGRKGEFRATAICPLCDKKFETRLCQIKAGIGSCDACAEKNLEIGQKIVKDSAVGGTSALSIKPDRALNRNSTTGHKGVSVHSRGKYRAYITFKRRQYHLGLYDSLEGAVSARKAAEKEIYGNFLEWYAETYPEQWQKINRKKK